MHRISTFPHLWRAPYFISFNPFLSKLIPMAFNRKCLLASVLFALSITGHGYVWPSPLDRMESIMFQQSGLIREGFVDNINPCGSGTRVEGRQNAAEWVSYSSLSQTFHLI